VCSYILLMVYVLITGESGPVRSGSLHWGGEAGEGLLGMVHGEQESQVSLVMSPVKSSGCLHVVVCTYPRKRLESRSAPRGLLRMSYTHLGTRLNAVTILGNR